MLKYVKENPLVAVIVAAILAGALFFGVPHFFPKSNQVEAGELTSEQLKDQPKGTATMQVTDQNGTRQCDIISTEDSNIAEVKAWADRVGCKLRTFYHEKIAKDSPSQDQTSTLEDPILEKVSPVIAPSAPSVAIH